MDDPALYKETDCSAPSNVEEILEKTSIKWKEANARVLDIGCGDGSVTIDILKRYIPKNFMTLIGCDRSQNSVDFAQEHYGSEKVQFMTLDIQKKLPDELRGSFDHIFSFYTFHWVQQQTIAFTNVYDMLAEGGNCLIVFLGRTRTYEVFEELSRTDKWKADLKDVRTKFLTPYFDSKDPAGEIRSMMERIGFIDVDVKVSYKTYAIKGGLDEYRVLMRCLNPFDSLKAKWDDFMDDVIDLEPDIGTFKFDLIVASGFK